MFDALIHRNHRKGIHHADDLFCYGHLFKTPLETQYKPHVDETKYDSNKNCFITVSLLSVTYLDAAILLLGNMANFPCKH